MLKKILPILLPTLCCLALLLLDEWLWHFFHPLKGLLLIFFVILSYVNHRVTNFGLKQDLKKFHQYYFGTAFIRTSLVLGFILFALFRYSSTIFSFVSTLLIFYFLYMIFEIYFLFHNLQSDSKKDGK